MLEVCGKFLGRLVCAFYFLAPTQGEIGKSQPAGNVSPDKVQLSNQACIQDLAFFKENWSLLSLIGKVDITVVSWLQGTNLLLFWFNEAQPCSGPLS